MNDKTKFLLIALVVPLLLILLGALVAGGILLVVIGVTWLGLSLLIFHPLEED
ncbi:MAG: hypothetical protein KAI64_05300 [Thermoplasmata archaeon]|nr:hypothetical protein [Thermoplasmata archaeon]